MPAFYNKEKSKHGTMSGSIISFPIQLTDDDPKAVSNLELIPAGYLRCDGRVLFATEYPELATVLGTGSGTKFLKEGQIVSNTQFQLPDLRNKHIRATSSSNIGLYNNLIVQDNDNEDVFKSGIGLDVVQNIESPYFLSYTGEFYIPPQTIDLRGEPRFTVDTGVFTSSIEVPANGFQPHMHRTSTFRARQKDRNDSTFGARQRNHVSTKSSLNVCQWWQNTAQPLCYYQWSNLSVNGLSSYQTKTLIGSTDYLYYGACFTGCLGFTSANFCLWPDTAMCPEVSNQSFDFRLSNSGDPGPCNSGDNSLGDDVTLGNITYKPELVQECDCRTILGICPGGYNGQGSSSKNSSDLTNYTLANETNSALPFSSNDPDSYNQMASGVSNITTATGETGVETSHRHRMDFESDEPHTYQMKTRAAFARADSGLVSRITISKNNEPKADKYIQPYIVTEYLIKI